MKPDTNTHRHSDVAQSRSVESASSNPLDGLGRPLRDLRISVTDRCNFRCVYCMPKSHFGQDYKFVEHNKLLSFEEIAKVSRVFSEMGVEKLRITGGEPLLRRNIEDLISQLSGISGIRDICMTTNGSLLTLAKARALKNAGLNRITISLDAIDESLFKNLTDVNVGSDRVMAGIEHALTAGMAPVKVNMVVMKGINDSEIPEMIRRFRNSGVILRFIEFMDVGNCNGWASDMVVPATEIIEMIQGEFAIEPVAASYPGEVAARWRYTDGAGEIGIVASVSQPFCSECNRARLSAEGQLHTCLFATQGHDLRALLRSGKSREKLADSITRIWRQRTDQYSEIRGQATQVVPKIEMSYIGG